MAMVLAHDDLYVLNHCTKFLARMNEDARHDFGQYEKSDERASICEAWRFPVIDSYRSSVGTEDSYAFNRVTFVYRSPPDANESVGVVGTFATLYEVIPLQRVFFGSEATRYLAVTLRVPKGRAYRYRYVVDGRSQLDSINPQEVVTASGEVWSRFFTHLCALPITLERWEMVLLERLVDHIMPFRTAAAQNFLTRFYNALSKEDREQQYAFAYRLDESLGIVNFIDKLLSREERHHLADYRICLRLIRELVREREPGVEPGRASKEVYVDLYGEMASGTVQGWNFEAYRNPQYFLQILRRHAYTGAFSHPKYGGNAAALGWEYLGDRFRDADGNSLFDWRLAIEPPLGTNADYHG